MRLSFFSGYSGSSYVYLFDDGMEIRMSEMVFRWIGLALYAKVYLHWIIHCFIRILLHKQSAFFQKSLMLFFYSTMKWFLLFWFVIKGRYEQCSLNIASNLGEFHFHFFTECKFLEIRFSFWRTFFHKSISLNFHFTIPQFNHRQCIHNNKVTSESK